MDRISSIINIINMISDGINPETGEIVDEELLRNDPEFQVALKNLVGRYRKRRKRGIYAQFEEEYPNHTIVMKEGYFYSAHNRSAAVLNRVLGYSLTSDFFQRLSTGGPDYDKISSALKDEGISFVFVSGGQLIERFDGENPFTRFGLDDSDGRFSEAVLSRYDQSLVSNEKLQLFSGGGRLLYPANLLKALAPDQTDYPSDVKERLAVVLASERVFSRGFARDAGCIRSYYEYGMTLERIGEDYQLSRERIRQLIKRGLSRMKRKAFLSYIIGEADGLYKTESGIESTGSDSQKGPAADLTEYPVPADDSISISEMARRLSEQTVELYDRRLRFIDIASWLVSVGDLEAMNNGDKTTRKPTKQGIEHGIILGRKVNSAGVEYVGLFLEPTAQWYIKQNLSNILVYLDEVED